MVLKGTQTKPLVLALSVCAGVVALGGCEGPAGPKSLLKGLQHENPSVRTRSCVKAARTGDRDALPLLVERLEDESADVRMFAIGALRRMTGKTLGYRFHAARQQRAEAVRRWREWLASNRPGATGG